MTSPLSDAERQVVIEDYERAKHGLGLHDQFTGEASEITPACGDSITVRVTVDDDGVVATLTWQGNGCTVSMASASVLAALAPGTPSELLHQRAEQFFDSVHAGQSAPDGLGDASVFAGIGRFPLRARCATLAWRAAVAALDVSAR